MTVDEKPIEFRGSSLEDLKAFSAGARQDAGYQLGKVQRGEDPNDWKPMSDVGAGVREIRIRDDGGAYRVLYVARFEEVIYVLHCFEKKTQKTRRRDLDIATDRYRSIILERAHGR